MPALQFYLHDVTGLLRDPGYTFYPKNQLIRWINEARREAAYETGCVRRLITGRSAFGAIAQAGSAIPGAMQPGALPGNPPGATLPQQFGGDARLNTIPFVERYPYIGFWNPVAVSQYAGIDGVYDIDNLSINWGGSLRPSLVWKPWDELQAYYRAYSVLNASYPSIWSIYNDGPQGEVWMIPVPSTANEMEADAYCIPSPLYHDDDFDVIPKGVEEAVKFKAAELALLSARRFMDASIMNMRYSEVLGIGAHMANSGKVENYYYSRW